MEINEIEIRKFGEGDSCEELTELLHRAYRRLADMGLRFIATTQSAEFTRKHMEKGECFLAFKEGKLIGTVFYYTKMWKDAPPLYQKETVALFGKFAIEPELQNKGYGKVLLDFIEEHARKNGKKEMVLDTSEKALHLIEHYKKQGYKVVHYWQWNDVNYRSVIMAKTL